MKHQRARLIFFAILTVFVGASALTADEPRAMTLVDLLNIPSLSSPRLSPDGRQLLYVLEKADWEANKQIGHIWRTDVPAGEAVQLTNGAHGESSPRWSPDGRWVAFLANRGEDDVEDKKDQIFLISNRGGEAQALTNRPSGAKGISWSPDGKFIYFISPDPKSPEQLEREKLKDDVFAFDENYQHVHLWKTAIADKAETRITQGDYSVLDYQLSNDGMKVAYHRSVNPLFGDSDQGEVWVMHADGTGAVQLTRNHVPETSARLSPDNKHVVFLAKANQKFEYYYNANLFLVPATGGDAKRLLPALPYEILAADWSEDGQSIFLTANRGVQVELFQLDVESAKLEQLTSGNHAIRSWHYCAAADRHVMSIDRPENPGDVQMLASRSAADDNPMPRQVTHVFDEVTERFRLPRQERTTWRGADGVEVEGLLFYPLDYQKGKRYPLVVQAHGGPAHSDRFGFGAWRDYIPILTARGYAIIKPNYRGSTGYGNTFLRDMVGHYFKNAHLDVMAGVDHLIQAGIADGDRMAMMGWSGGGHMTNKIITFTDRFKAASSGAGAVNWISMYGQSDVRIYRTPWFGGTPWQEQAPIDVFWEHSPLKHIAKVKTPTIVLVGEKDVRVPMPQSVELYRALKSNGVATHLYVAPRVPHGWNELRHRLFKMNVELDWFEKHVRDRKYTWEKAPTVESGKLRAGGITVTALNATETAAVELDNGTKVRVAKRVAVNVDPKRDLHGPCVIRAANGDLLLSHQDSNKHGGGDGFARQWRSTDNGFNWKDEGPVADWRKRNIDSLFGEYGLAADGRLVMIVQRRKVLGGNLGIVGSWLQTSTDHGRTWKEIGPVDGSHEYAVMFGRSIIRHKEVMYVGAWSRLGNSLYISEDNGLTWKKRSVIFPTDYPDFANLKNAGPPFYPHVVFCPDGSLLAMTYHTPPKNHCYSRRSHDNGKTWGPIVKETGLTLWAPRMNRMDEDTLIVTGRDIQERAAVAWFSTDNGKSWGNKLILDKPKFAGSYAYTDSIGARDGQFWVFTSSPQSAGKGDIVGVLLEVTRTLGGSATIGGSL